MYSEMMNDTYICLDVCVFEVVQKITINKKDFHFEIDFNWLRDTDLRCEWDFKTVKQLVQL